MAMVGEILGTPSAGKPSPRTEPRLVSDAANPAAANRQEVQDSLAPPAKKLASQRDTVVSVAARIVAQPLPCSDPDVWGVLTAISNHARKRTQGMNMLLSANEHSIGRTVEDTRFQIESNAVSQRHCKIFRRRVFDDSDEVRPGSNDSVYLIDTSTNGTYVNWERLKRGSSKVEAKLHHGDIISFVGPPHYEQAFVFVYREVSKSIPPTDGAILKRKAEEYASECKRSKGIGIGASEGPISLDDFRSLQRSNTELRKQLEDQVLKIEALRNENRAAVELHDSEKKGLKELISKSYLDQVKELKELMESKRKEVAEAHKLSAEQKHAIEDLNERLAASSQSCADANDIIKSQKTSIAELESQLDEERDQRREEREKAAVDMRMAVQRVQSEAEEELKRASEASVRRERELEEVIIKLQESERERSSLVEGLRSKLEEAREKVVTSDNKVRQLEAQIAEEQKVSSSKQQRVDELEIELKSMRHELESEKQAAREEAWAKVSVLELEINAAMRDLDYERRRFKGARERIMLRENQLRAFYSTTEEISVLFSKQQEQLKHMQRTLEDQENYDEASLDAHANPSVGNMHRPLDGSTLPEGYRTGRVIRGDSAPSAQRDQVHTSSDEASVTEKHDCSRTFDMNTQEAEYPLDGLGAASDIAGDVGGTEFVPESDSPDIGGDSNIDLNRCLDGDTMQLDDDTNLQDTEQQVQHRYEGIEHNSQLDNGAGAMDVIENTEPVDTLREEDHLASEVEGNPACGTTSPINEENESPERINDDEDDNGERADSPPHESNAAVAVSQSAPPSTGPTTRRDQADDRRALCEMVGIIAPDLKDQFQSAIASEAQGREKKVPYSDSDTEDEKVDGVGSGSVSSSDVDAEGDVPVDSDEVMDEDDDDTQEDSDE
ncbi:hypothetical protein Drorol1_Dr00004947 [Drosera rotundifolia]